MLTIYSARIYFPLVPQVMNPVVLEQIAVREEVRTVVDVIVVVEVLKANKKRALPAGAENPGWTMNGTVERGL